MKNNTTIPFGNYRVTWSSNTKLTENNNFKKGDYVVLLAGCDGTDTWKGSIPIDYCYKLREDSNTYKFSLELDINGSDNNGWYLSQSTIDDIHNTTNKQLKMRYATL